MNNFTIEQLPLPGLLMIKTKLFGDRRGFFLESYNKASFAELGLSMEFVQDNRSRSVRGVLRGMHFQKTKPQGKLISVLSGAIFDVAVDMRAGSPTLGGWYGQELIDDGSSLYVPEGFAHGFCVLSESADFEYKCTNFYAPEDEGGLLWNDPTVGIKWPIEDPLLSDKDELNPKFEDAFRFEGLFDAGDK